MRRHYQACRTTSGQNFEHLTVGQNQNHLAKKKEKKLFFIPIETNFTLFKTICRFEYV